MTVVAAVIEENNLLLITRRQEGVHLEGLWEFPGGKVAPGETHEEALRREIREELDTDIVVQALLLAATHAYSDRTVSLHFYRCRLAGTPRPVLGQAMRWAPREELASLSFPPADDELIKLLMTGPGNTPT